MDMNNACINCRVVRFTRLDQLCEHTFPTDYTLTCAAYELYSTEVNSSRATLYRKQIHAFRTDIDSTLSYICQHIVDEMNRMVHTFTTIELGCAVGPLTSTVQIYNVMLSFWYSKYWEADRQHSTLLYSSQYWTYSERANSYCRNMYSLLAVQS